MTHQEIIDYATARGVTNPRLVNERIFGWSLCGGGRCNDGWPLVWKICRELKMTYGCGSTDQQQCSLSLAKMPEEKPKKEESKKTPRMCSYKESGKKTLTEITQWSVTECKDADLTDEIQKLVSKLKLLISHK